MVVPLYAGDALQGVLYVDWTAVRAITPGDLEVAEALGAHAAVAIRTARLVEEAGRARVEAERRAREQAVVATTAAGIAAAVDRDDGLRVLLTGTAALTGADAAAVRLPAHTATTGLARVYRWRDGTFGWDDDLTLPGPVSARVLAGAEGLYIPDRVPLPRTPAPPRPWSCKASAAA